MVFEIKDAKAYSTAFKPIWLHYIQRKLDNEFWQYELWSFQKGGTKLERFLPKNQHNQKNLLNFEVWINGELSKSAKI